MKSSFQLLLVLIFLACGCGSSSRTLQQLSSGPGPGSPQSPQAFRLAPFQFHLPGALFPEVADFTGDGRADVVTTDAAGQLFFLQSGENGLSSPRPVATQGGGLANLAVADFNGDGHLDFAGPYGSDPELGLWLGDGAGAFAPQPNLAVGGIGILAADMNRDGRPDLVVVGGGYHVLLNQGGTFAAAQTFNSSGEPTSILLDDFNGDQRLDLVATLSDGFELLPGNGDGTLGAAQPLAGPIGIKTLASGDIDQDGHTDLLVQNASSQSLFWFPGQGDFSFGDPQTVGEGAGLFPKLVDLNADGLLDLAYASATRSGFVVALGLGGGQFQEPQGYASEPFCLTPRVGDLNGDRRVDLLTVNVFGAQSFGVHLNRGDGSFRRPARIETGEEPNEAVVGDFDEDGIQDLIVTHNRFFGPKTNARLLRGRPEGLYAPGEEILVADDDSQVYRAVAGDFNSDGHLDLYALEGNLGSGSATRVVFYAGGGDGTFEANFLTEVAGSTGILRTEELNGDGRPDIWFFDPESDQLLYSTDPGDVQSFFLGPELRDIWFAQLDSDPPLELILGLPEIILVIEVSLEDLSVSLSQSFSLGGDETQALDVGDFNGDGLPDLVAAGIAFDTQRTHFHCFLGEKGGRFNETPASRTLLGVDTVGALVSTQLRAVDLDQDGRDEALFNGLGALVLRGREVGGQFFLDETTEHSVGFNPTVFTQTCGALSVVDANRDGRLDLVAPVPSGLQGLSIFFQEAFVP